MSKRKKKRIKIYHSDVKFERGENGQYTLADTQEIHRGGRKLKVQIKNQK